MMNKLLSLSIVSLSAFTACKVTSGGGGGAAELPAEFQSWVQKDADATWQGAWSSRLTLRTSGSISMAGDPAALEIKGGTATAWDGTKDHKLAFALITPCTAQFSESDGGPMGMTSMHDKTFLVEGGKLLVGEGPVGYRKGKAAFVCTPGMDNAYTLDDKGVCKKWSFFMKRWEGKPTTCVWSQEDGKDVLTVGDGNWTSKVKAEGDLLKSDQFIEESKYTEKATDLAAAKAKTDETIKAKAKG